MDGSNRGFYIRPEFGMCRLHQRHQQVRAWMDLLLLNGLPWYIVSAPSYEALLLKLVADGLVSTELVARCKWMFPAAWAHRRRVTVLGRCVCCGSRYEAVDSREKSHMLLTERILGEYAAESTERVKIHVSPFSTTKNECGGKFACQQLSRAAGLKTARRAFHRRTW